MLAAAQLRMLLFWPTIQIFFFLVRRRLLLVLRRSITRFNTQTQMTTCMALHSMNWEWLFVFVVSVFFFNVWTVCGVTDGNQMCVGMYISGLCAIVLLMLWQEGRRSLYDDG